MPVPHILILGAGITGLTAALALHNNLPSPKPRITIYEIRSAPSTIGGAVNLTPKALRYLDQLGILQILEERGAGVECKKIEMFDLYSGARYAEVDFGGKEGQGIGKDGSRYFARRVMRREIQAAMLEFIEGLEGVSMVFGKKVVRIEEGEDVRLEFEDGEVVSGDCLLGCDGIHSAARRLLVDPERQPTYTGISVAMATSKLDASVELPPWTTTGLVSSRRGSLMCSYYGSSKGEHFIGAVIEIADVGSREGWKVRGADQEAIQRDLLERFRSESMPANAAIIEAAREWTLYPVFTLPEGGKWISPGGRCILLGDAAHAMPPQGESTGICIEDAMVFSRAMMQHQTKALRSIFHAYENFRQARTDQAVKEATWRFETVKDKGWLAYQLIMRSTSWFLWWTAKRREAEFSEDVSEMGFEIAGE